MRLRSNIQGSQQDLPDWWGGGGGRSSRGPSYGNCTPIQANSSSGGLVRMNTGEDAVV